MKRRNPLTDNLFVRGDAREDGKVFYKYTRRLKLDGLFQEIWVRPEALEKERTAKRTKKLAEYERKSDRMPAGWNRWLLARGSSPALVKRAFQLCMEKDVTREKLKSLWLNEHELELLLPYTCDYEYKS